MPGSRAPEDQRREEILRAAYAVAARERLTGFTVQQVAEEAGISKGLVFFYFQSRDRLLVALLEWMLRATVPAPSGGASSTLPSARDRLLASLRSDIEALPRQRERVELFFDFWVMGTRHPDVRLRIRRALDGYRDAYRPLAEDVVRAEPERYTGVSGADLAGVATGFVTGCALQAVMDPDRVDGGAYMAALHALVARPRAQH